MRTVSTTAIAALLGKTDNVALEQQVTAAVSDLERKLGYPLCGTAVPQERIFRWTDTLWHRTHPMYLTPTSIVLVGVNAPVIGGSSSSEQTITDYQLGQNGKLEGNWFNMFKLCNVCQTGRCIHCDRCEYIKITAAWGFAAPEPSEESGDETVYCVIPDDLFNVLLEAVKEAGQGRKNIQKESTGTRSYNKFAASYQTVWQKHADIISFYKVREPRL